MLSTFSTYYLFTVSLYQFRILTLSDMPPVRKGWRKVLPNYSLSLIIYVSIHIYILSFVLHVSALRKPLRGGPLCCVSPVVLPTPILISIMVVHSDLSDLRDPGSIPG